MAKWIPASSRPGYLEVARNACAPGEDDRVEPVAEEAVGDVLAHIHAALEGHAFLPHEVDALVDDPFLELEVGDAVSEQAAGPGILLEHGDVEAPAVEHVGCGQAGRAGADDGHALPAPDAAAVWP